MNFGDYATLQDSFTRADEGPPMTGWTAWLSSGLKVVSNQMAPADGGDNGGYLTSGMSGRDVEAYITIATHPVAGGVTSIIARANPTGAAFNGDGYWVTHLPAAGTDQIQIEKMVSGTNTVIAGPVSFELAAGDKLGIRVIGTSVEAWAFTGGAWVLVSSVTNTDVPGNSSQNKIGIYNAGNGGTGARYDDLTAGTIVNDPIRVMARPPMLNVPGVFRRAPVKQYSKSTGFPTPQYFDYADGSIVLQGSSFDIKGYVDSRAGSIVLQGQAFDNRLLFDSRAGSIVLQGTRVDSLTFTDSRSGSIVLQGTRVDGFTLYDSRTGSIVLQGARIESIRFDETGRGTIVLQGTESDTFTGGAAIPVTVEPEVLSAFIDRGWGRQDHGKEIW